MWEWQHSGLSNRSGKSLLTGDGVANAYTVVGIDPEGPTGSTLIWSFAIGSAAGGGKEVVRYDIDGKTSNLISRSYFGKVWRIEGESGTQVWLFNLGNSVINHISIIEDADQDGLNDVLVGSFDSNFYCLSGADGTVIWSTFFGNFSWSARAIPDITDDGQQDVAVASRNDNLYVLNGADGTVELQYAMNSGVLQGATLAYTLPDIDNNNSYEILAAADNGKIVALSGGTDPLVGTAAPSPLIPDQFELKQNYPNPFNPITNIEFSLPQQSRVTLIIRDILGRTVATIYQNESLSAGVHRVTFDGRSLASGLYFYQIRAVEFTRTRKMILMK
jgi:hypothetical protein